MEYDGFGSKLDSLTEAGSILFGFCDFITQFILVRTTDNAYLFQFIHLIFKDTPLLDCVGLQHPRRDHSCNLGVGILGSANCNIFFLIQSLTESLWFLVMWITTGIGGQILSHNGIYLTYWGNTVIVTCLTVSMVVNALVTGLIVFKIFKVFREVKGNTTEDQKSLGVISGSKLRSIIFVIIESGMTLFIIQLVRLVVTAYGLTGTTGSVTEDAIMLIAGMHAMLNVIILSVIARLYFTDSVNLARL